VNRLLPTSAPIVCPRQRTAKVLSRWSRIELTKGGLSDGYLRVGRGRLAGGWCWKPIARHLRNQGHDAYPVTLTGLGERSHLAGPEVDLETHITDVVSLIEFEDLSDVVLLGHSYAGIVVTGAADRIPERVAQLIYLDSGPVPDGLAYLDTQSPEVRQHTEREVRTHGDGWRVPMPSWDELENVHGASLEGLGEELRELMRSRAVAQPFGTYTQPLRLGNVGREASPKLLITNSFGLAQVKELIASEHPWFRELAGPEWRFLELPTGHWPMFSRPDDLAALLIDIPASEAADIE
jgi:pimeloyl-ACP methyl ester carboxylesterase